MRQLVAAWSTARAVLDELGALTDERQSDSGSDIRASGRVLTQRGRALARLPSDPQIGRILLAGVDESVAADVTTIAAWLSIQDPRVRPQEEASAADRAHLAFYDEAGDIASALRLWDAWQEAGSNSARAKLCRKQYLGLRRMREWADVRHQLWQALRESAKETKTPFVPDTKDRADHTDPASRSLDAIHRCVLAGLLGTVACWDKEAKCYRTVGGKQAWLHPGSGLTKTRDGGKREARPQWLVAAEVVETSRRFVRGCAPIDPAWVLRLLGDRVTRSHRDPRFDGRSGRVVVTERVAWKGLVLRDDKPVAYAPIDPVDAVRIFCREGLAGDGVRATLPVLVDNRAIAERCATLAARLRDNSHQLDPDQLAHGYTTVLSGHTPPIASVPALKRWLRDHGDDALRLNPADLVDGEAWHAAERGYPMQIRRGERQWPLAWRYVPGYADDGATLELAASDLGYIGLLDLDHAVPGWLPERVEYILRQLPKDTRRRLNPLRATAEGFAETIASQPTMPVLTNLQAPPARASWCGTAATARRGFA